MEITFLGHASFRIKGKSATVVTDPFDSNMVGLKFPDVSADIVTISHDHADHNQYQLVSDVKKVIETPGEYEIMGVSIVGLASFHDNKRGEVRGGNTIYVFESDGLRVAHLGDLGHDLSEELVENIGNLDILFTPVGGEFTIGPSAAVSVVQQIEPKVVIPMHYRMPGLNPQVFSKLASVDAFLKEVGLSVERLDRLSLKKEELGEIGKVVVLSKR